MNLNKNGFTLVELLVTIVIIAILATIVTFSVSRSINNSKEASYNILVDSIVLASKNYYIECTYNSQNEDIFKDETGNIVCDKFSVGKLANLGFLKVNEKDNNGNFKVLNPINNVNISECMLEVDTKNFDLSYTTSNCPNYDSISLKNNVIGNIS